jgi:hypothetical protein
MGLRNRISKSEILSLDMSSPIVPQQKKPSNAQPSAETSRRRAPPDPIPDHARRIAVHASGPAGGRGSRDVRQQYDVSDPGDHDFDAAGLRLHQPLVPGRTGARSDVARTHLGGPPGARETLRTQSEGLDAFLFHSGDGRAGARAGRARTFARAIRHSHYASLLSSDFGGAMLEETWT